MGVVFVEAVLVFVVEVVAVVAGVVLVSFVVIAIVVVLVIDLGRCCSLAQAPPSGCT